MIPSTTTIAPSQSDDGDAALRKATRTFLSIAVLVLFVASNVGVYVSGVLLEPQNNNNFPDVVVSSSSVTVGGQPALVRGGKVVYSNNHDKDADAVTKQNVLNPVVTTRLKDTTRATKCNMPTRRAAAADKGNDKKTSTAESLLLEIVQGWCGGSLLKITTTGKQKEDADVTTILADEMQWQIETVNAIESHATQRNDSHAAAVAFVDVLWVVNDNLKNNSNIPKDGVNAWQCYKAPFLGRPSRLA